MQVPYLVDPNTGVIVGDDAVILGCGAPLLPSIGMVDAMRKGQLNLASEATAGFEGISDDIKRELSDVDLHPPMTFQYQTHASGLIGSPTLPSSRSVPRLCRWGSASPHFMNARMAVGAV